ncbi:pyridoxal phosphate-dependent aminotransferase [Streptomyces caelestis]|uniref:CcbF n=1 Tax=Streptomyces caelestis TaxID=36816 RepID=E9JES7_9ACTN|nr:pyridoxal phosphate-dependent aminotransferase [Streptomyces caelestis]ADB92565.1 CcbF [Streptomyces caelestis]MBB5794806.1 N-succinyldiaminopimelate aminotransferase [Streptomyces caelestis]GGW28078.1 hypothetical protein GCM10010320_03620 [Streptomyces caelestis]
MSDLAAVDDWSTLRRIAIDAVSTGRNPELKWLADHPEGTPAYALHLADPLEGAPEGLRQCLREAWDEPLDSYVLSHHGLPELRQAMERWFADDENWPRRRRLLTTATMTGTGPAMYDLLRTIKAREPEGPMAALVPRPGWDYRLFAHDVGYEPIGYHVPFTSPTGPEPGDLDRAVEQTRAKGLRPTVLVLNPQHYATGGNWTPEFVRYALSLADTLGMWVLVDNAYHGMTAAGTQPTSTVRLALDGGFEERLIHVRTLGKQFACNGWAVGSVTAMPDVIDEFAHRWRGFREYPGHAREQAAFAGWLNNPESRKWADERREAIRSNGDALLDALAEVSNTTRHCHGGSPFVLFEVPGGWSQEDFRQRLFADTGVLLASAQIPYAPDWVKVFLGRRPDRFLPAVEALRTRPSRAWQPR